MIRRILYIVVLLAVVRTFAQENNVLDYDEFIGYVLERHPVAKQAALLKEEGRAYILKSKGAFDPKLSGNYRQKNYSDKDYYTNIQGLLKIPTRIGVDLKAGYESGSGDYVNPELSTPQGGLVFAGVSVPVGQGMFIDARRAELRKAKIFAEANEAERQKVVNDLIFDASAAYWNWVASYHIKKVYGNGLILATNRLDLIRREVKAENRPHIDTVEAKIQVQNRTIELRNAENVLRQNVAFLSIYLWDENDQPLELVDSVSAPELNTLNVSQPTEMDVARMDSLLLEHPEYLLYDYKMDMLEIDRKLKREQLKPIVNINYNPILQSTDNLDAQLPLLNNYKWGLEVGFPLFLRKERGDLKLTEVKLADTQYDQNLKFQTLRVKAKQALYDWSVSFDNYLLMAQSTEDYGTLLNGEQQLFQAGESTIFMVNSRENKYLDAQVKTVSYLSKNRVSELKSRWSMANMVQ